MAPSRQKTSRALDADELLAISEFAVTGNQECQKQILDDFLLRKPSEYGQFSATIQILQWPEVKKDSLWARAITRLHDPSQWPAETLEILRKNADEINDPMAQTTLGGLYRDGKGVNQDHGLAFQMFEKAAIQGNAIAQ